MSVLPNAGLATLPVLIALLGACDRVDIGAANRSIAPASSPPSQTCWTLSPVSGANLELIASEALAP